MQVTRVLLPEKRRPREPFTPEEDDVIRELVSRYGDPRYAPWAEIAAHLPDRSPRQVRERFQHYLSPGVSGDPWSREEDDRLRRLHAELGSNWAAIAAMMPGRANTAVKNRWNTAIKDKDLPGWGGDLRQTEPEPNACDPRTVDFEECTFDMDGSSWFDEATPPDDSPWGALQ
jgi:hypothetical protein